MAQHAFVCLARTSNSFRVYEIDTKSIIVDVVFTGLVTRKSVRVNNI